MNTTDKKTFKVTRTSDNYVEKPKEKSFRDLEHLLNWCASLDDEIILDVKEMTIEIYDSYRE